jgi:hypothetical protein
MYVLWNKKSFKDGVKDYLTRLKKYNKFGDFPLNIISYAPSMSFGIKKNINETNKNVRDIELYKSIKADIYKKVKSGGRRWGAYDSGRLVRRYKLAGGRYKERLVNKINPQLGRWYDEKWIDACAWPAKNIPCGRRDAKKGNITYCRPSVRVNIHTPTIVQDISKNTLKKRCYLKKNNPTHIITHSNI